MWSSITLPKSSLVLLESSFIVLENIYCTGIAHDGQNMFIVQVTGRPDIAEQFCCVSECLGANVVFRLFFLNFASVTKDLETNFLVRQTSFILHPQCKMRQRLRGFLTTHPGHLSEMVVPKYLAQLPLHCREVFKVCKN